MRLALILGLAVAALAARSSPSWPEEGRLRAPLAEKAPFRPGYEYRFHFDGQIATGLPVPQSQQALTRMQSIVTMVFPSEHVAHMQIDNIRIGTVQKELGEPKVMQPFALVEETELTPDHSRLLRLPFRFRYERGLVSEIEFDQEEQPWSANIKRAILNMLQVNMDKQNERETPFQTEERKPESGDFFTAQERTLEGDCEMTYTVVERPSEEEREKSLRLTKSVNFEKCTERVGIRYNFRFGDECPSCDNKWTGAERNVESSSVFNYDIVGSPSKFIIREVELRSQYIYTPFSEKETFFKTTVTNKLTLVAAEKRDTKIATPKSEKKETLLYSNEWNEMKEKFAMTGDDSYIRNSPYTEMKNKPEVVAKLVKLIVKEMSDSKKGVELAAPHQMARLVKVLRMVTKEEMNKIHREVCDNSDMEEETREQMRDLLNDALAMAGTKVTLDHLVEKMRTRQVSPVRAAVLLKTLTNTRTPSEQMIESLVSLCKEQSRQPVLRQACWLTVGSFMNGVCGEHRDLLAVARKEKQCSRQLKQQYIQEIMNLFEQSETRYEKVLALKTLANSGMDMIVFPLEKIIFDRRQEKSVRVEAIDALRQLRSVMPRKVQSILMPLYKDQREQPEIRVAAFHQIMQTVPERAIIDQLTQQLEKEPSHQVYSFVYTALTGYADSTIPCEKRMAEDIKTSLQLARIQPRKVLDSHFRHLPYYNKDFMAGGSLNWAALFSNDSVLPKEVMAKVETAFAGQWHKYLAQVGISQQNIDTVIAKLLKQIDEKGLEQVLVRGKRSASGFQPAELLKGLFQKLAIKGRQLTREGQDAHAMIYFRFRDLDYAFLPIDEQVLPEMLKQIIRNGRIELGEIESILAKGYRFSTTFSTFLYERSRKVVTTFGMPIVINSKMPTVATINGKIHLEVEPKNGKSFEGLRLRVVAQPSIASTHITKMEIWSPIVNQGIKLLHSAQLNTPVDMVMETKWEKNFEIKTTFKAPEHEKRVLQIQSRPVTFVRVWPKEARTYVEPKEKTIYINQLETLVKKMETEYTCKATGLKVAVDGHVHGHLWQGAEEQIPSAFLAGENNVEIRIQPTEQTPKEYVMKLSVAAFEKENLEQPEHFRAFYEKSNEEHFEVEQDESYPEEEKERRVAFNDYLKQYKSRKSFAHRVVASVHTVGAPTDKQAKTELRVVCDDKIRHCKIDMEVERSPLLEEERKPWTMVTRVQTLYPEMPSSLYELKEQKHREFHATIKSEWGAEKKNHFEVKIQGEQNKQQKAWMARVAEQKKEKSLEMTPLEEYSLLVEAAMLNQYKAVAEYKIESRPTLARIEKLFSLIKSYSLLSTEITPVENKENRLQIQLTVEPETRQYFNLSMETPRERVTLRDIRLPVALRLVNIRRQPMNIRSLRHLGEELLENQKAECRVESNKVNTFDDVIFRTPITTCYSVLAKDCSDNEQPEFAVLMKKVEKRSEEKKIKIISKKNIIEIEKSPKTEKMIIKINGEKETEQETLENFGIFQQGEKYVTIKLEQLKVEFDGFTAEIKMSELYKSQQCGVCGHFDGEKKNELRRADNEETEDIEEFHRSYLLSKDEECEMDEETLSEKKNYELLSRESSSSEEESLFEERKPWMKKAEKKNYDEKDNEIVEPIEKTRVIEYSTKVCFSKKAVPECPRKSYEQETKQTKVVFSCIPRSSPEASRLIREARREILSIEEMPESFTETLSLPKMCIAY